MPSHKVLRGIAYSFAHSFLGLGSWYLERSWPVQYLLMAAREAGVDSVRINLLQGSIDPPSVTSKPLLTALSLVPAHFREVVQRSGATVEFVSSAEISVAFRFAEKRPGKPPGHSFDAGVIVPEMVPYTALATIIDDRGVTHQAKVKEWWHN